VGVNSGKEREGEGATYAKPTPAITGMRDVSFARLLCLPRRTAERKMVNKGADARTTWWNCPGVSGVEIRKEREDVRVW